MSTLFDALNGKMFAVFAREDRELNFSLLQALRHYLDADDGKPYVEKEEVVAFLSDFIKEHPGDKVSDEEGTDLSGKPSRFKALAKIRQFKKDGWLVEDTSEGFQTTISFDENARELMIALEKIAANRNKPLEYTGYIYTIHALLMEFDQGEIPHNSTGLLEQAYDLTMRLNAALNGLSSTIKHFLDDLLDNDSQTAEEIYRTLLYSYQDQVIMTVFNNLRGADNPARYSSDIIRIAKRLLKKENVAALTANYIGTKNETELTSEKYEEIEDKEIRAKIRYVLLKFQYIGDLIAFIDWRNTRYLSSAKAKLRFILSSRRSVEDQINLAVAKVKELPEEFDYSSLLPIYSSKLVDASSIYERNFVKTESVDVPMDIPDIPPEELELQMGSLLVDNPYSIDAINAFAASSLGGRRSVSDSEIAIPDLESFLKLVLLELYWPNEDIHYHVEFKDNPCVLFGYKAQGFVITPKEEPNHE